MTIPTRSFPSRALALILLGGAAGVSIARSQDLSRESASEDNSRVIVTGRAPGEELPALGSTTATRLPQRILDTPRSVGVVNTQTLEDRQVDDPQEAVQNVSGAVRAAPYTGVGETFLLRGFVQQDIFKDGFRAGGTPGNTAAFGVTGNTDVANIERIEVLKGPASILYGRGQPGGLVNYVTNRPYFGTDFALEQQFGSYDFYRTQLNANWQALPNKLAARVDAAYETSESFTHFVAGDRVFIAPSLLWQITPRTTLTLRGEYTYDDRTTNPGLPYLDGHVLPGVDYDAYLGEPDFARSTVQLFRGLYTLEQQWSDWAKSTLSVHTRRADNGGGYLLLFNFAGPFFDPTTNLLGRAATTTDFAEENIGVRLDNLFTWTLYENPSSPAVPSPKDGQDGGADGKTVARVLPAARSGFPTVANSLLVAPEYERQTNLNQRRLSTQPGINPFDPQYVGYAPVPLFPLPNLPTRIGERTDLWADSWSLLIQNTLSFGDIVHLSFAERTEWFASEQDTAYPSNSPLTSFNARQTPFIFNPSAGIVVKPASAVSLYFSYAESTDPFTNLATATVSGAPIDPEDARQYEAGVKAELLGGKLLATTSVYQVNRTNIAAPDPANPLFTINAGEQRNRGFEIDLNGEPLPGWRVILNYSYIDAHIIDDPTGVNTGHRVFGVPENSGGFFTTYEFQDGPLKGLGLGGGMYFADRVQIDLGNTGRLAGYAQTDLVGFYHRGPLRVQFNVKNLFDNEFYYAKGQNTSVTPAQARTLIGSVAVKF